MQFKIVKKAKGIIQYAIERKTLIRVHVKINPKASVLNMNCCRALTVNLQKVFYNSQASLGDRQYIIILFISIRFLPTILYYLNDRDEGRYYFCRILAPPPPLTPQYLTILMTERGRALYFVGFWRPPPQCPPPSHDATILNYLNDREGGAIFLCRILAPPPPSPDATILINDLNGRKRRWGANIL